MSDYILMNGDQVMFLPAFGQAIVVVKPGKLQGSGKAKLQGNKICLAGDEKKVSVPGCTYMTPVYSIPGMGTLQIASLAPNQKTKALADSGKAVLLKGSQFTAKFAVTNPAKQPNPSGPPTPDSMTEYKGQGQFISRNIKCRSR